eukprot:Opistho-1_new@8644
MGKNKWGPTRGSRQLLVFKIAVLERKLALLPLAPARLVVEIDVRALLVLVADVLRVVVALEPRQVLLVEPPALLLELSRSQVLLVRALLVVEDKEERVRVELVKVRGVLEHRRRHLRVVRRRRVRVLRDVDLCPLRVNGLGHAAIACIEHLHRRQLVVHARVVQVLAAEGVTGLHERAHIRRTERVGAHVAALPAQRRLLAESAAVKNAHGVEGSADLVQVRHVELLVHHHLRLPRLAGRRVQRQRGRRVDRARRLLRLWQGRRRLKRAHNGLCRLRRRRLGERLLGRSGRLLQYRRLR